MRVVFVRQFVHLTTYFFSATDVTHVLAEFLVADEPVVNTQEVLLLAFLLERIRDVVLVIPWLLPVTVPVGSPFLQVVMGNREEVKSVLDKFLVLLRSVSQEVPARAIDDADSQYDRHTLHCALGSVSRSSHNSMFPAASIMSCDSLLKGLND